MLGREENGDIRPVLIDFGLSKHYDNMGRPTTTVNTLGVSEGYSPREQYSGISSFSPQSDIMPWEPHYITVSQAKRRVRRCWCATANWLPNFLLTYRPRCVTSLKR